MLNCSMFLSHVAVNVNTIIIKKKTGQLASRIKFVGTLPLKLGRMGSLYTKVTRRPVLNGTVSFFNVFSRCPDRFCWDGPLSRFVRKGNLFSISVVILKFVYVRVIILCP